LHLVNGSALIARLASRLLAMNTPLWTSSPVLELEVTGGRVAGAWIERHGRRVHVRARRGVILASGGFSHDVERRTLLYRHDAAPEEHLSLSAPGNQGDGARMAESAGGWVNAEAINAGAWMPTSKVPRPGGGWGPIAHSVNLGKPGVIAVLRSGIRFADESLSYHDFVERLLIAGGRHPESFIVCDAAAFKRYGLGFAKPFLPIRHLVKSHYLFVCRTPRELAERVGLDVGSFTSTVVRYNEHARRGVDPEFGKGISPYGHFLGDPTQDLNPNVAPLAHAPFYAIRMYPGDIGTFAGVETDAQARVVRRDGSVVNGLFAVGNDMASVFKGRYPGGGALIGPAMTFGFIAAQHIADHQEREA
jgi:succinate dehydrogenase/fumarate reductase flavoprotein subunit